MIKLCRQVQPDFKSSCHRAKLVLSRFWYLNIKFSNFFYVHIITNYSSFRINLNFANISYDRLDMIEICRQFQPDFKSSCHRAKFVLSRFWQLNVVFQKTFYIRIITSYSSFRINLNFANMIKCRYDKNMKTSPTRF